MIGGHGPVGRREDVVEAIACLEELRDAVLRGLKAGKSVADLKRSVNPDRDRSWANFDRWRELNIEGLARDPRQTGQVD